MKKKILIIIPIVLVIIGLLVLNFNSLNKIAKLEKENEEYAERIENQTSDPTSYTFDEGSYTVGGPIPEGTVTLVALNGNGSYYIYEGDDIKSSGLLGDYDTFKLNNNFKSIYKVVLKKDQKLVLKGENLKTSLIYNMKD